MVCSSTSFRTITWPVHKISNSGSVEHAVLHQKSLVHTLASACYIALTNSSICIPGQTFQLRSPLTPHLYALFSSPPIQVRIPTESLSPQRENSAFFLHSKEAKKVSFGTVLLPTSREKGWSRHTGRGGCSKQMLDSDPRAPPKTLCLKTHER